MTHHRFLPISPLFVLSNESDIYFYNVIKEHTLSEVIRVELGRKSIDHASKKEYRHGRGPERKRVESRLHRSRRISMLGGALRRHYKNTTSAK